MNRIICGALLSIFLAATLTPAASSADNRAHRDAVILCKQKYRNAIRGAKYLKSRQRSERIEQARRERAECEKLAPK
jgi:phage anti-repressor protein